MKKLETTKEIMEAFLAGKKLTNSNYYIDEPDPELYVYLDLNSGFICEEDGAGAKSFRVPILMRDNEKWWEIG